MGLDVAHFAALPRAPTAPPTILVVARLVPVKGVDVAITACRQLLDRGIPLRLVIAGDGPQRAELTALATHPAIQFLGAVDTPSARDRLLGAACVVVIPSRVLPSGRTEGTPLIALEALAANVPVIASRVGGLANLAATLVTPDSADAILPPRFTRS